MTIAIYIYAAIRAVLGGLFGFRHDSHLATQARLEQGVIRGPASHMSATVSLLFWWAITAVLILMVPLPWGASFALVLVPFTVRRAHAGRGDVPVSTLDWLGGVWRSLREKPAAPMTLAVALVALLWAVADVYGGTFRGLTSFFRGGAPIFVLIFVVLWGVLVYGGYRRAHQSISGTMLTNVALLDQLSTILGVKPDLLQGHIRATPDGGVEVVNPPPAALTRGRERVMAAALEVMPELMVSGFGPAMISFSPLTEDERARRHLVEVSDGLVTDLTVSQDLKEVTLTLAPGVSPAAAERVEAWLHRYDPALTLTGWYPYDGYAMAQQLSENERAVRDRVAAQLKAHRHEVQLTVTENSIGHRTVEVSAPQLLSADQVARRRTATELTTSLKLVDPDELRWRVQVEDTTGTITLFEEPDLLRDTITMAEFRTQYADQFGDDPATSWKRFPIAVSETGQPVPYSTFHSLIVGQTGSGKGSAIWGILGGVMPAAEAGYAELYGVDPKGAEAVADDGTPRAMFRQVATTPEEWAEMVSNLVDIMDARKGQGRKIAVTPEQPLIILMLDELSAITALDTDVKRSKQVMSDLLKIASQGRSLNVLIVAAVQAPQKELLGALRQFLSLRIALRTETAIETDLVLGAGSTDAGGASHLIPVASEGNGYRTAGLAYLRVEGGGPEPVRVRFPYTSDADLDAMDARFRELRATGALPPQIEAGAQVQPDRFGQVLSVEHDDGGVVESELELDLSGVDFGDPEPVATDFADIFDD